MEIEIDISRVDLAPAALGVIAAKVGEHPLVMTAVATGEYPAVSAAAEG
jgi:hypothetical protein